MSCSKCSKSRLRPSSRISLRKLRRRSKFLL